MITIEVGKRYKTKGGSVVRCVYADDRAACHWFLMVDEKINQTFWTTRFGEADDDLTIITEIPQRQTSSGWVNVYRDNDGELCMGEFWPSLDKAKAASAHVSVGIIPVTLVNNIETGEVDG